MLIDEYALFLLLLFKNFSFTPADCCCCRHRPNITLFSVCAKRHSVALIYLFVYDAPKKNNELAKTLSYNLNAKRNQEKKKKQKNQVEERVRECENLYELKFVQLKSHESLVCAFAVRMKFTLFVEILESVCVCLCGRKRKWKKQCDSCSFSFSFTLSFCTHTHTHNIHFHSYQWCCLVCLTLLWLLMFFFNKYLLLFLFCCVAHNYFRYFSSSNTKIIDSQAVLYHLGFLQ